MSDELRSCRNTMPDGADGVIECATPTLLTCFGCQMPVCASCSEDSWLAECNYYCPECWGAVPDHPEDK